MAQETWSNGDANIIVAAIEQGKQELRDEFDDDIKALGIAVFGTTDEHGRLLKRGALHSLVALDRVLAFLCAKLNVTPEEVEAWDAEQRQKATVPEQKQVTLD